MTTDRRMRSGVKAKYLIYLTYGKKLEKTVVAFAALFSKEICLRLSDYPLF